MAHLMRLYAIGPTPPGYVDGAYLEEYDPDGHQGFGRFKVTTDKSKAKRYANAAAAWEDWRRVSTVRPLRDDGKPNRPLTAFTVEISPEDQP